jgi:hypothetical protein
LLLLLFINIIITEARQQQQQQQLKLSHLGPAQWALVKGPAQGPLARVLPKGPGDGHAHIYVIALSSATPAWMNLRAPAAVELG